MDERKLELWRELRNIEQWKLIEEEIVRRIGFAVNRLKVCVPNELPRIQAEIEALEELKRMPDAVIHREEGQASQ